MPESVFNDNNYIRSYDGLIFKIYFNDNGKPQLFNQVNQSIQMHDVYDYIIDWQNQLPEELKTRFVSRLRADKKIPLKYIKQFEAELIKFNHLKIIYEVENNDESTTRFYNQQLRYNLSLSIKNFFEYKIAPPPPLPFDELWYENKKIRDTISVNIADKIFVNDIETEIDKLSEGLKKYIKPSTIFEYTYSDSLTYQDYIDVLSTHKKAVYELRDTEGFSVIDRQFHRNQFISDKALNIERQRIIDKYPINVTERLE